MQYQEVMETLSACGLGALVTTQDGTILCVNEAGDRLLHGEGKLNGLRLQDIAAPLCEKPEKRVYASVAFGEYLCRCPAPVPPDLPEGCGLVVFREATNDACHDMLISVLNQISESVILCDAQSRIYLLNDAAVKMDSIVTQDVLGEKIENVYRSRDGSNLIVPEVIREKRPNINKRQYYTTRYGKNVDIVSNNFPVVQNGQLIRKGRCEHGTQYAH